MYSVVNERPVVVLEFARVVSRNLQPLNPDLDVEPIGKLLLQLQRRRVAEDEEPSRVLHVVVVRLCRDGDATMSARIYALKGFRKPFWKDYRLLPTCSEAAPCRVAWLDIEALRVMGEVNFGQRCALHV